MRKKERLLLSFSRVCWSEQELSVQPRIFCSSFLFFPPLSLLVFNNHTNHQANNSYCQAKHPQASNQSIGFSSRKNLQSFSLSYNFPSSLCYFFLVSVKKKVEKIHLS